MWYLVLSRPVVAREQMMGSLDDHLTWMRSQHEASNVLFSGPTADHSMGIYVIRAMSRDEAQTVADSDPFHSLGFRNYEMLDWDVHQVMGAGPFSSGEMAFRREMAEGAST